MGPDPYLDSDPDPGTADPYLEPDPYPRIRSGS